MTNRSTRALFHSKTLNTALRAFSFPQDMEVRRQKLGTWIAALKTGTLDEVKEVSLHGSFINDIFQDVLGYRSVIQGAGKAWEINAEQTISDGGGSADGAIGFFTAADNPKGKAVSLQGKVIAPIELKGAKNDLDRPASGRSNQQLTKVGATLIIHQIVAGLLSRIIESCDFIIPIKLPLITNNFF
jgi:hypothetical protein